jgi:Kef-type K+ transport system membrane component KefB
LTRDAVPAVVGQLLAGVALGEMGLRVLDPSRPGLALFYTLGFATLMLTVGCESRGPRQAGGVVRGNQGTEP